MKHITTYHEEDRTFEICKDEHGYWAFEDKYIDEHGCLTKQFNGGSGCLSKTINETIRKVSQHIKFDKLVANGVDPYEAAFLAVTGA